MDHEALSVAMLALACFALGFMIGCVLIISCGRAKR